MKKEDIEAAIKFFKSRGTGEMKLGEALRLGLAKGETNTGLPIVDFGSIGEAIRSV